MLVDCPERTVGTAGVGVGEGEQPAGPGGREQPVRLRAAPVQVDRDPRGRPDPQGSVQPGGVHQPVDAADQVDQRGQPGGRGERQLPRGVRGPQRPQRGHRGHQIADAEGAQHEDHGYEVSCSAQTTSSRTAQPDGWLSANMTAAAVSAGR